MSKPPKIDRKSLKNPDEFVKTGMHFLDVLAGHRRTLLILAGCFVGVVAGVLIYKEWQGRSIDQGWKTFYEAKKKPEAERWDAYKKIASESSIKRPQFFAMVELADHYYDAAKNAKPTENKSAEAAQATEWYGKALTYNGLLPMEAQLLHFNRGSSLELEKKLDEAMKEYELAAQGSGELKGLAVVSQGRLWELKGDLAKAKELYAKVAADFPNGDTGKLAKNSIRRLASPVLSQEKL